MEEVRVDMRELSPDVQEMYQKHRELLFRLNHTMPQTDEYMSLLRELLAGNLGKNSTINPPLAGAAFDKLVIGEGVFINSGLLAMARGGITVDDGAMIAANVQLISNNHDPYDRAVLTCKPVHIGKCAWIGAGATVLPGVTVGKYAIVGAASVVTHDVPDYGVAVGNPAKVIKMLDPDRFVQVTAE